MNEKQQPYNGQIDEALLTAFALDELEGPERALVEAALKTDHKAQEAVEEIREVAGHLRDAVTHDEEIAPSASLREMIEERLEGKAPVVVGDCPSFRLGENGTVPLLRDRRRRWAVLAVASAAVLLLAVTIPSLQMFRQATTSDVAMEIAQTSPAPAADLMAQEEPAEDWVESSESAEEASMVEPKGAAPAPLDAAAGLRFEAAEDAGMASESFAPAKPAEVSRLAPKDGATKSARVPALVEQPARPAMKGSARYMYDRPDRESSVAGAASDKRENNLKSMGKAPAKADRGMARSISPNAAPAPTAPTQAWSHRQAAGPAATPVPYPTAVPAADGEVPLTQSQMMPRAKAAPRGEPGAAPAPAPPQPAADPFAAPAAQVPAPAAQGRASLAGQTTPDLEAVRQRIAEMKKAQGSQPAYSVPVGPGYGEGMGYGGGMGGYGMEAVRPRGAQSGPGTPPPTSPAPPVALQLGESIESKPARDAYGYGGMGGAGGGMKGAYGDGMGGYGAAGRGYGEQAEGEAIIPGYLSAPQMLYEKVEDESPDTYGAYDSDPMRRSRGRAAGQQFGLGTEQYAPVIENAFQSPVTQPESTVSADVDTASYANVRRFLEDNQAPPPGAVRIEEMVNYFAYDYPQPDDDTPFSVDMETASCPWNESNRLVQIGLKAKEIDAAERGPSNLVFLLDVSGSMRDANKLPLVKDAMAMLVDQLTEDDRVSIVTYAGEAGLALEPTEGTKRKKITDRIEALKARGSTHGSAGIQMAYDQAMANFVPDGNNRVILCTDGDLNVGITDDNELVQLIQEKASGGVFLTVVGFGTGNLKDAKLEQLADKGNGKYAYVDGLREAKKVFVEQASGSLVTVAKDVKIQIEFNPAKVQSYRLIGYENRLLATQDFNDDMKDAGEIGAGHSVTFLYEVVPTRLPVGEIAALNNARSNLRYQQLITNSLTEVAESGELLALKLRYKLPDEQESRLLEFPVMDSGMRFGEASSEFRFAASVAAFGLLLRGSQYNQGLTFSAVEEFAAGAADNDPQGRRGEFVELVRRARGLYGDTTQVGADAIMLPSAAAEVEPAAEPAPAPPE